MAKVTVYKADLYDVSNDTMIRSRRWFTRKGAERVNAELDEQSGVEIDEAELEEPGLWTARNYSPSHGDGFQRQVTV